MIMYRREFPSVWSSSCSTKVTQPSSAPSAWTCNTTEILHTSNCQSVHVNLIISQRHIVKYQLPITEQRADKLGSETHYENTAPQW